MANGKVKWFNNAKGFGFILPDEGDGDLFAHYSSIQMDGYKTLKAGQDVEYDLLDGPKGRHATNIRAPAGAIIVEDPVAQPETQQVGELVDAPSEQTASTDSSREVSPTVEFPEETPVEVNEASSQPEIAHPETG